MNNLNFYWRMGDYALEACPKGLARFSKDKPNETINTEAAMKSHV